MASLPLTSRPTRIWPAARRTILEIDHNTASFSWPSSCHHMLMDNARGGGRWQIETCPTKTWTRERSVGLDETNKCVTSSLDLPTDQWSSKIEGLRPCHKYEFRLRRGLPNLLNKVRSRGDPEIVWTFDDQKTLPNPNIRAVAGHSSIHLIIDQVRQNILSNVLSFRYF